MLLENLRIRTKLVGGICILLLVSCGGLGIIAYQMTTGVLQKTITEALPNIAVESAKFIRSELDKQTLAIEGIAGRLVIRSMDWTKQKPALESEINRIGCLGMGIVTPDGTAHYPDGTTAKLADRDYIKKALDGTTAVSDVIISRVTNQPVMMIAAPIRSEAGTVLGAVLARYDGLFLSKIVDKIKYGKRGYSYVINKKGVLIAHGNREYVLKERNFLEEGKTKPEFALLSKMMSKMSAGETGFDEYWFGGMDRLLGFAPIGGTGWSIAIGAIKEEVFTDVYAMRGAFLALTVACIGFGVFIAVFFARSISKPIMAGVSHLQDVSFNGNLTEDANERLRKRKDEIGSLAQAVQTLVDTQRQQTSYVQQMADGNWDLDVPVRSQSDHLGIALQKMIARMNHTLRTVMNNAVQVDTGSAQIAAGSQSLSQGATTSASSLQQISASMTEIAGQTRNNADNAQHAKTLSDAASEAARKGDSHMGDMVASMKDIDTSSQQISKIIKAIDDIAFQTNLLALNAAVEAARAGSHGKGFAVVAEEVRNLAARSAKAAQETAELIEASGSKVAKGSQIANQTAQALAEIVTAIAKSSDLIGEIAFSSKEQADGVAQVNIGLEQIDSVTQQNTAAAEETAAAAEGLARQAQDLRELLARFQLSTEENPQMLSPAESGRLTYAGQGVKNAALITPQSRIDLDDGKFGNY